MDIIGGIVCNSCGGSGCQLCGNSGYKSCSWLHHCSDCGAGLEEQEEYFVCWNCSTFYEKQLIHEMPSDMSLNFIVGDL